MDKIKGRNKSLLTFIDNKVLGYLANRTEYLCNYTVVNTKGRNLSFLRDTYTGCISTILDYRHYKAEGVPLVCVYNLNKKKESASRTKMRKRWVEWLMYRSVLKHTFVFKDEYNPSTNGIVVTRCDISQGMFGLANNILRIGAENDKFLETWCKLVNLDVPEELAFSMMSSFVVVNGLVTANSEFKYFSHSVLENPIYSSCSDFFWGIKSTNETFRGSNTDYMQCRSYKARDSLKKGTMGYEKSLIEGLKEGIIVKKERRDLMGRVVSKGQTCTGYLPEQIVENWRAICEKYK